MHTPAEVLIPPVPIPAPREPPTLSPDDSMVDLGHRVLRECVTELLAQLPRDDDTPSASEVHRMRVAARRVRVALQLFGHMLVPAHAQRLRRELRWLSRRLSRLRDLDVQKAELRRHARATQQDAPPDFAAYGLWLRRERAAERAAAAHLFHSERFEWIKATLIDAVSTDLPSGALRRWRSFTIADGARCLKTSYRRVVKLRRKLSKSARVPDLHRFRIKTKRLRYQLEFFAPAYPVLGSAARAAKSLQDALGEHRDAHAAIRYLDTYRRRIARDGDRVSLTPALSQWRAEQRQADDDARCAWPSAFDRLADALDELAALK